MFYYTNNKYFFFKCLKIFQKKYKIFQIISKKCKQNISKKRR